METETGNEKLTSEENKQEQETGKAVPDSAKTPMHPLAKVLLFLCGFVFFGFIGMGLLTLLIVMNM